MPTAQDLSTLYLSAADVARLVDRLGLPACLHGVAQRLEHDFGRWTDFDKTARVASHSPDGVIELMPVSDESLYAFKYVNGHPKNTQSGLATVMAFGVLADVATGAPRLLASLTLATAIRTAAMSALAARVLARPGSRTMALIGNGAQSEFQALAFRELLGIDTLRVFDTDPRATAKLLRNLHGQGLRLVVCGSTAEAVRGADIVTTVTADKALVTIVTADMVEPGMHLNAVGGDCPGKTELSADVLQAASVFVEYEPQTRIEGDIQQMPTDFAVTEFWQVLAGRRPGRTSDTQVTVFDSVGFALEDHSALCFLEEAARHLGLGDRLSLVPDAADPKDLFGSLARPAATHAVRPEALAA
ncbi:ornithine cyclodeaminase [Ideonella sp. A 288]|uniref:ornithine cyclodeaminase n=1 Tax=Ideonella sp. A 288 TaxID=1962181 RepID=UPI000B4B0A29|nr:ornithine cyclodeaminase [Ideonella sp. A 288]